MLYEALFKNVLFPAYETVVRRRDTARYVAACDKNQWLSGAQLKEIQLQKVNALLNHCWLQVPFLQQYWRDHDLGPASLKHLDELAAYPVITKDLISDNYEGMIASNWRGKTLAKATGGSTGQPFRFEYTMDSYARRTAAMWRGYGWAGAGLGARTGYLWGTGMRTAGWGGLKDRVYHGAFNRRFFDVTKLTDANIDRLIDDLADYKPDAIVGYVAPLALISRRMLETGRRISHVRGVITAAEALFELDRQAIEAAFGCPAFNTYGSREVMLMAAQCDRQEGLHVTSDHLILETVDAHGTPVPTGHSGSVAVTDLHNYGMPLVRYINGDCATFSEKSCSCGRGLPLLSSIDGRLLDLIRTPDGRLLPGEAFVTMSFQWPAVFRYQVVQTAADTLQLRLVLRRPWGGGERDQLIAMVQEYAGQAIRVDVVEVDDIPANATGKRRITVSLQNAHTVPLQAAVEGRTLHG